MSKKDEALKLALEALKLNNDKWKSLADFGDCGYWNAEDQDHYKQTNEAIAAVEQALEQPVQEPVAWMMKWPNHSPSFTTDKSDYVSWFAGKASYPDELVPLYTTPPAQPAVPHPVIAGVLFDFMGWLTSREARLTLSSTDAASPAVEAITEFAKMRCLSLDDARVRDWQDGITKGQP
jgi:hypothetical protein